MSGCEHIQIELSALLDGESDPGTALEIVDHVAGCEECRTFWRELRAGQETLDRLAAAGPLPTATTAADDDAIVPLPARRGVATGSRVPQWAWGLAAVLLLAIGLGAIGLMDRAYRDRTPLPGELLSIQLEEDKDGMNELRFVEMTTELLRSDRRYHDKMYEILDRLRPPESPGESPRRVATLRSSRRETSEETFGATALDRIVN